MGRIEKSATTQRAESVVNRTLAIGGIALVALVAIALVGGEAAATAAVATVGTIVAGLVRLTRSYLRRPDR
ncbi:hypothetical protein ABZ570_23550 [Micromonospora sp. NPDC007271]|uniref:hypothetical protein n=1 Tax=Micromonospora sp. NPDC007271 TaxID=3154587 RepID=UPI0033F12877